MVILDNDRKKDNEKFCRPMISCKAVTKILYGNSEKSFLECEKNGFKQEPITRSLHFRKFKVALNPMYRIFLNFAKSCVLSCLSKVDNIKKFHRAVFEL